MKSEIRNLKGFRDILPTDKRIRDKVTRRMREIFEVYGFEPIETPTLEAADLLLGKYGDEADQLVYNFKDRGERDVALRYDQTVPTARILSQYRNELPKYFRRYQIQNVFRADKPQKGRFREFTQCDFDVFGSKSPIADAEILACVYFSLKNVGFKDLILKVNDRETLMSTLNPFATDAVSVFSIIQSIDKLDKVSEEKVIDEIESKGLDRDSATKALSSIKSAKTSSNLQEIISATTSLGVPKKSLVFTPTLARGLDYYTGMIFEVLSPQYAAGSMGGGGRYDKLIEQLSGGYNMPAVGVGLGFDRIVEAATELSLITLDDVSANTLVTIFSEATREYSLSVAQKLRQSGVRTEVFVGGEGDLGKQMKYANQIGAKYVVIAGEDEMKEKKVTLKEMESGKQKTVVLESAIQELILNR